MKLLISFLFILVFLLLLFLFDGSALLGISCVVVCFLGCSKLVDFVYTIIERGVDSEEDN